MDSASDGVKMKKKKKKKKKKKNCHASLVNHHLCLLAPGDYRLQNPSIVDFPTHYCEGFAMSYSLICKY